MSLIDAVRAIINSENDFETKLSILTEISISTTSDELFRSCERVRNELVESGKEDQNKRSECLHSSKQERDSGDNGALEPDRFSEIESVIDLL